MPIIKENGNWYFKPPVTEDDLKISRSELPLLWEFLDSAPVYHQDTEFLLPDFKGEYIHAPD